MKNILIIFATLLFSITFSTAQSLSSNQIFASSISNTYATIDCDLYGQNGTQYKIFVLKDGVIDDSATVTGAGFANAVNWAFVLDSLNPSTTYGYEFRLVKNGVVLQTTNAGYSFTTTANPQQGVINTVTIQPILGGLRVIVTGTTYGALSKLIADGNEVGLTGYPKISTSKNVNGNFLDTIYFSGLNLVQHYIRVKLIPLTGILPVTQTSLYYGTPANPVRPLIVSFVRTQLIDTLGLLVNTNPGNGSGVVIKLRLFNSLLVPVSTQVNQTLGVNNQNTILYTGLVPNTVYYIQIIDSNSFGKDSLMVVMQTLPIPAPVITGFKVTPGTLTARSVTVTGTINKGSTYPTGFELSWVTITPLGGATLLPVDTSIGSFPVQALKPIVGLASNTIYTICLYAKHNGGIASSCIQVTTPAPKPAPVISTTPIVESSCAALVLKSFPVTVASGDLGTVFIYGREGKTNPFILLDQKSSNTNFVYQGYSGKGFKPNTYYEYMVQTMSMDSSMSSQLIVGDVTINSTEPKLDTVQVSDWLIGQYYVTPKIIGHAGCDNYKLTYVIRDMNNVIVKSTWVNVSGGMFVLDSNSISGLVPNTSYKMYYELENSGDKIVRGPQVFKTLGATSGIENQNTSEEELWNDESNVIIYDMVGQKIFSGTLQDAKFELANKTVIAVKQITNNTQKRQVKKFNF